MPFMVIATMNPVEQAGTYALPEAQLDRFLMKTSLGYPDHRVTVQLLADAANRSRDAHVEPMITAAAVTQMVDLAATVHTDTSVLEYVSRIAEVDPAFARGGPRGQRPGLPVVRAGGQDVGRGPGAHLRHARRHQGAGPARARPPDPLTPDAQFNGVTTEQVIGQILSELAPPTERGPEPVPA